MNHINEFSGFYSVLVTLIMVGLTLRYVILTKSIVDENQKMREQNMRPYLYGDFEVFGSIIHFSLVNSGNSPAKNIEINIKALSDDFLTDLDSIPDRIEFLPQAKSSIYRLNIIASMNSREDYHEELYEIDIKYEDSKGTIYNNSHKVDLAKYITTAYLQKDNLAKIEGHLKSIKKDFGSGSNSIKGYLKKISKNIK